MLRDHNLPSGIMNRPDGAATPERVIALPMPMLARTT
jgi:hypothetical protein